VLAAIGGDIAEARARVIDLVDDVVAVAGLPLDPRHRARVDRRRLQHQLGGRTR
jgi:hypothetical protein